MKVPRIAIIMNDIDDDLITGAADPDEHIQKKQEPKIRYRFPKLAAALIALCLIGTGVIAVANRNPEENWFTNTWSKLWSRKPDYEYIDLLGRLSQKIGVSQTIGDVTVTVDSAMITDYGFSLLIEVSGPEFPRTPTEPYFFEENLTRLNYEGADKNSPDYYDRGIINERGVYVTGNLIFMMEFSTWRVAKAVREGKTIEVDLKLKNLMQEEITIVSGDAPENNQYLSGEKIIAEGEWNLGFTVDCNREIERIELEDAQISAFNTKTHESITVPITDMILSNTSFRFVIPGNVDASSLHGGIAVVLKNGKVINANRGSGTATADGQYMRWTRQFSQVVNLDDVAYVRFYDTDIPLEK